MVWPSGLMLPLNVAMSPEITLMSVLLPQPLGPENADEGPKFKIEVETVVDDFAPEGLAQTLDDISKFSKD